MTKLLIILLILTFSVYSKTKLGIDVLIDSKFESIKNKNIALVTNHSGRTGDGKANVNYFVK